MQACLQRKTGFTEAPILKTAGCSRAPYLQQTACCAVNAVSASLQHYSLQSVSKVAHLSFLHPPGMNDTGVWHTAGSTELGMRAEGRKRGRRRGREAASASVCSSETLPCSLGVGIPPHTGGNLGRGNWDGRVGGWEQALSMHTENGGGCVRFLFLKALLHAVTSCLTSI